MRYNDCEERNYANDHRVRGAERRANRDFDEKHMALRVEIEVEDEEGCGFEWVLVPAKFEVCPTCDGRGSHVNPNIDCNGLTREDFDEDPDFALDYKEGLYDVPCYECEGRRVIPVVDRARCDPRILKMVDAKERADAEYAAECAAERRMGY